MITNLIATAYCCCRICCGPDAAGLAADGKPPRQGLTVAGPRWIPLGARIQITSAGNFTNRTFTVTDRLAERFSRDRIDFYFEKHQDAKRYGKQTVTIQYKP